MTLPDIPAGTVLYFTGEDQRPGNWPVWVRVSGVRPAPIRAESDWMWVDGRQLALDGTPLELVEVLVRVAAVKRAYESALSNAAKANNAQTYAYRKQKIAQMVRRGIFTHDEIIPNGDNRRLL
jgi:hypothetical protein